MSPLEILKNSFIIYILFIFLAKQTYEMFILNILLIFTIFILFIQIKYEKNLNSDPNNLIVLNNYLQFLLVISLIVGFVLYYNKQYNDHKENFNNLKFLLGTNQCSNIKDKK